MFLGVTSLTARVPGVGVLGLTGSSVSVGAGIDLCLVLPSLRASHLLQAVDVFQAEAWVEGEVYLAHGNGEPRSHPGAQLLQVLVVQHVQSVVPGGGQGTLLCTASGGKG